MTRILNLWLYLPITVLLCSLGVNAYADMYFESSTTDYAMGQQAGQGRQEKTYLTADKMKTIQNDGVVVILRLDKGLMWNINSSDKTYTEMSFKQMKESAAQAMKVIEESISKMSPEERKQMEQFMPQLGILKKTEVKIEETGKKKDISGYKCELTIATSDTIETEMWITKKIKYDKDAKKFLEGIEAVFSDISSLQQQATMYKSLIKIDGFPMETTITSTMGPRSYTSVSTVTSVENREINDSEFELPRGLSKVAMPQMP